MYSHRPCGGLPKCFLPRQRRKWEDYLGLKVDIIGRVVQCKWSPVTVQQVKLFTDLIAELDQAGPDSVTDSTIHGCTWSIKIFSCTLPTMCS